MAVDVFYEGFPLARGVAWNEGFLALATPMPVGTLLALVDEGGERIVRVSRVQEGAGAGAYVVPSVSNIGLPDPVIAPAVTDAAPMAPLEMEAAPRAFLQTGETLSIASRGAAADLDLGKTLVDVKVEPPEAAPTPTGDDTDSGGSRGRKRRHRKTRIGI